MRVVIAAGEEEEHEETKSNIVAAGRWIDRSIGMQKQQQQQPRAKLC